MPGPALSPVFRTRQGFLVSTDTHTHGLFVAGTVLFTVASPLRGMATGPERR